MTVPALLNKQYPPLNVDVAFDGCRQGVVLGQR